MHEKLNTRQKHGIFLLFLVFSVAAHAQSYSFKHFTTNDGLVQTDITDIKQDKKGNIWIGTNGGISVYNGKKFTNYDDHDLLQSLRINALLCDSAGAMWIATPNGLLKYVNSFKVFFKPNKDHHNAVSSLTANSHNQLLFVCNSIIYQVKGNRVEKYKVNGRVENEAMFVSFDRDDNLWIITNELDVYRKTLGIVTPIKTPFTAEERKQGLGILKILGKEGPMPFIVTNFGTLWVKDDSLHYFNEQYPQYRRAKIGQATFVLEANDSTVWVGGVVGMSKLSGRTVIRYVGDNGFCDNSVSTLFTDSEKNLWVGTTYNGVYKLGNEALFHLKPPNESFDLRHVSDIAPVSANATLISTWGKGLYLFKGDSISKVRLPEHLRYISSLFTLGDHTYVGWFGGGLWKLNNQTFETSLVPHFARNEAVAAIDRADDQLVFQTLDNTCYLTDLDLNVRLAVTLPEGNYIAVLKDKIYQVRLSGEVDLLDDSLRPVKRNIFPEVSSRITEIACYRDHFLVGTFGQGLFLYNPWGKLVKRLDKKNGLTTNIITSLLVDGSQLYMGTNLGMVKADLPSLASVKVFKESEGMFSWECRQEGLRKLADGAIMVATTNGPYLYYPHKDNGTQNAAGRLSFASFSYGENRDKSYVFPLNLSQQYELDEEIDHKDGNITIVLSGVSQRNPDGITYHYQLTGYDSAWVTTTNPQITFNGLNPGEYHFKAYLRIGGFQSDPASIRFSIDKPLSGKLWFQVLLILFLSGLCWVLLTMGNRVYQKYIQSKMVGKLEADIAHKQHLTAQTISFAQHNYKELSEALRQASKEKNLSCLTTVFLKDVGKRIELLWKKDGITIGEFHQYFDELLAEFAPGAKVYHKYSVDGIEIPMTVAFHLLQVFSLYFFIGLYNSETAVFSLDTENKSNGQLLMRFYNITHEATGEKMSTYHFLKDVINGHQYQDLTVDVIENLEFGNMVIAELNLQNEHQL